MLAAISQPAARLLSGIGDNESDNSHSKRRAIAAFSVRVVSAGIAFFSQIVLARWMGIFDFGIFTYVYVLVNVIGTFCTFGFATTALRFLPEYGETSDLTLARGFLRTGRSFSFGAGLACTILGLAVLYLFDDVVADYYRIPMALGLVCLPAVALTYFQDGVGRAHSWTDLGLVPPFIWRPCLLLMFVVVCVGFGWPGNAETAIVCAIAANWLTVGTQLVLQQRRLRQTIPGCERSYRLIWWLKISMPALLLEGIALLMLNLDLLLLDIFVAPDQIALYFAAARTTVIIGFVHFAVAAVTMPKFAALYANNNTDGVRNLLHDSRKWVFIPTLAGSILILALGKPLLSLFGPGFTESYPVMFVLVLGLLARAAAGPVQGLLVVTGHQNMLAAVMTFVIGLNALLNLLLIPNYGLIGAAMATSGAFGVESVLLSLLVRHKIDGVAFAAPVISAERPPAS